jgi:SAM-dependent methyltransferase
MSKKTTVSLEHDTVRERRAHEAIRALEENSHKIDGYLLDIGCGKGQLEKIFYEKGSNPVGIDISFEYLKEAKNNSKADFVLYDGTKMPFKEEAFETIICNDVFEHISYEDANSVMQEANRILQHKGKFYVSVMNRWEIFEPHWFIPFFTWLPRSLWNSFFPFWVKMFNKKRTVEHGFKYTEHYFPYTKTMAKSLFQKFSFNFIDITSFYAKEKINDPQYIGSKSSRRIVKTLHKLKLSSLALSIANRISVLVFICNKNNSSIKIS